MTLTKPDLAPGVITGKKLMEVLEYARENKFALPAVNVVGSNSINAALEAARQAKSILMIQFSNGGAHFNSGKFLLSVKQNFILFLFKQSSLFKS